MSTGTYERVYYDGFEIIVFDGKETKIIIDYQREDVIEGLTQLLDSWTMDCSSETMKVIYVDKNILPMIDRAVNEADEMQDAYNHI